MEPSGTTRHLVRELVHFLVFSQAILLQLWTSFAQLHDPEGKTGGWRRQIDASTATILKFGAFLLHLGALGGQVV